MIHTPEYVAWYAMKNRCFNQNSPDYPNWGGRGVTVYGPWVDDFVAFCMYVGHRPSAQHSLDRYPNPDGNYEPGNVRWASKSEQNENRRPTVKGPAHGNYAHGGHGSPEYKTWSSIKTRCFNTKHERYALYGGVGITMCSRWRENFSAFLEDLGRKPEPEFTLSRSNHDGHYSCGKCSECQTNGWPSNCGWATKTEQNRNRRSSNRSGKLTAEKVNVIRQRLAGGSTYSTVAQEFGICLSLVGKIKRREVWA